MSIGFIGAGNMATAIIKGYIKSADTDIYVYDIDSEKVEALVSLGAKAAFGTPELAEKADYLFLAVKPQNIPDVLSALKDVIRKDTIIVSIAAAITAEYIKKVLNFDAKVVLVMPNTPLLLGYGASALAKVAPTSEEEFAFVEKIFQSSGETAVIPANQMNEIISVHGSTPAYIYQITKHFLDYAEKNGIDPVVSKKLFAQMLIGSAKMITDSGYTLDELIQMVSSKGGTTIAGLESFRKDGLGEIIEHACNCCTKRAYELAK